MRTLVALTLLALALLGATVFTRARVGWETVTAESTDAEPTPVATTAPPTPAVQPTGPMSEPTPTVAPTTIALESTSPDEVLARVEEVGAVEPTPAPAEAAAPAPPAEAAADNPCDRPPGPLPAPNSPGAGDFWQVFRTPLPPSPVWNPPGPKRVGLQAGHWRVEEVPPELGRLGGGSSGGGRAEWEVNLDVAQRAAALLEQAGVEVDVLPSTIPPRYRAHAFLAIHADGDESGRIRGYKLARAVFSATPQADDELLESLYDAYGRATGLPRDDAHISRRMTGYYAFNSRRYCHAVAPGTPSAIIEMGFLTSAADRQLLLGNPDAAAEGIARGLLRYFGLPS